MPKPRLPDGGQVFVILKKIILGISTICLWLFFQVFPRSKSGIFDSILNKIAILGQPPRILIPMKIGIKETNLDLSGRSLTLVEWLFDSTRQA